MSKKGRVVAAMSGGVDSCVATAMLKEQGYDVVGITMQLWDHAKKNGDEGRFDSCCSLTDVHDARVSAHKLGVPHYVVNYEREFKTGVVDYFASEYAAGRTPNPCVMCNSKLKFDHLAERAKALGADWVATGHYARVVHHDDAPSELLTGVDPAKDQSYFLFDVKPEYLKRAMFPLGGMTKKEVRAIAAGMGLHTAEKHESQEICFVTGRRYTDFLDEHYGEVVKDLGGEIVDREGNVVGRHDGYHKFTVGQRKGLGGYLDPRQGSEQEPLYVAEIDALKKRVVVDKLENLSVTSFEVAFANWLVPFEGRDLSVMVRYRARTVACRVERLEGNAVRVLLADKTRWVTPGQAAVFYDGERVIGGGFIRSDNLAARGVRRAVGAPQTGLSPA